MPGRALSIGEVSRRSGVHVETIRYYERIGLLPRPPRTEGGHRLYPEGHLRRLVFIRRGRELGFTLDEIRTLLRLAEGGFGCGEVRAAALAHLADIRRRIADLRRMERILAETAARCAGGDAPDCPVMEALGGQAMAASAAGGAGAARAASRPARLSPRPAPASPPRRGSGSPPAGSRR